MIINLGSMEKVLTKVDKAMVNPDTNHQQFDSASLFIADTIVYI